MPGQCAMLSMPGIGEAMFSITSSPTNQEFMEFSIKRCGGFTEWLHQIEVGAADHDPRAVRPRISGGYRAEGEKICCLSPAESDLRRFAR